MQRRAVIAIVCATVMVAALVVVWFLAGSNSWGGITASSKAPTAQLPPQIPGAVLDNGLEQQQSGGTPPTAQQIDAIWQPVVAASANKWTPWMAVVDANNGQIIAQSGIDTPHTPASTMKLLTAFTALSQLDPDATLATGVSQDGQNLFLWGEGDITLSAGHGDPNAPYGAAGIEDIADQVVQKLRPGGGPYQLFYQDSLYGTPKRNDAWVAQNVADYAGDVAPFAIDTGRTAPGEWMFVDDSAATAAQALSAALSARGVTVAAPVPGTAPTTAKLIAEVHSATLFDQIRYLLVTSDNTMAEQFCHLAAASTGAAPVDFSAATGNVLATLQKAKISTEGSTIKDCSGLDEGSKVPPRVMLQTLETSLQSQGPVRALTRILPISGINGTLEDRLETQPTHGNYTAKTGSLGMATAIDGIGTTKSGANLYVLVGADNVVDEGAWEAKDPIDKFVSDLFSF